MNLSRSASADTFSRRPASTDILIPRRAQINITLGDLGSLLPCVLYIVMAILLFVLYDLDDMKHQHIVNELDKRRRGLC